MIKGQLWVEIAPGTSDMALKLMDAMAKDMADKMNCDIAPRESAEQMDAPELVVWWPLIPRS